MERASSSWAWLPLAALWLCAAPLHAQQSVSVLGLMSEDGDDELAAKLSDALRAEAAREDDWRVAPSGPSLSQLSMAFDCELRSPKCLREMTANLGMDLVVYGTMHREGAAVTVEVGLFDVYGTRTEALAHATVATDSETPELRRAAQVLVAGLRGRKAPPEEDAPVAAPAELPPDAESEPSPEVADEPASADSGDGKSLRWLGYSLLGVAGASAVMTVVSWVMIGSATGDETFETYRLAIGESMMPVEDSCAEAEAERRYGLNSADFAEVQDICSKGATWEVLQYVFLGTAIATGAAGVIVLLTQGGDEHDSASARARPPRLSFTPAFDRRGGSLTARLRF